jgi:hypothetical protein
MADSPPFYLCAQAVGDLTPVDQGSGRPVWRATASRSSDRERAIEGDDPGAEREVAATMGGLRFAEQQAELSSFAP